jgi:hypothetical protein
MQGWRLLCLAALAAVLTSAGLAAGTSSASTYDFVRNGGFEDGYEPWSVSPNTTLDIVGPDGFPPAEGAFSARVTLGATIATLRQTTREGLGAGTYHVSASVRVSSQTTSVYIDVESIGPTVPGTSFAVPVTTTRWTSFEQDVTTVGIETLAIKVRATGSSGDMRYVDDVHIEGAPPVTMTPTASPTSTLVPTASAPASPTRTPIATHTPDMMATADDPAASVAEGDSIGATIRNAGFESVDDDGLPSGWHKYGGVLASDGRAHTGSGAARLSSETDSTKWLYQPVVVNGGQWYELGAWVLDDDAAVDTALLRISWYASTDASGAALATADSTESLTEPSPEYRFLTTDAVEAPADARSARLRVLMTPRSASPASIVVDDASFGAAERPDPSVAGITDPGDDAETADAAGASDGGVHRTVGGTSSAPAAAASRAQSSVRGAGARSLVINEVMYDPMTDPDADGEWVELYNPTSGAVALDGWQLADATTSVALPPATVASHGYVVIAASARFADAYSGFDGGLVVLGRRIGNSLGNDGDRLTLTDPSGAPVDAISWGIDTSVLRPSIPDAPAGHSIERATPGVDSDTAADFVDNERATPGRGIESPAGDSGPIGGSARVRSEPTVEVLAGDGGGFGWVPWVTAGLALAALLGVAAWRAAPVFAERMRRHA